VNETVAMSDQRRRLLEALLAGDSGARGLREDRIPRRAADVVVGLAPEQLSVWLHSAMSPDLPIYNEAITIHRFGSFDLDVLRRSLNALIDRHEIWRTTYQERDGRISAVVHDKMPIDVELLDVSGLAEAEREKKALEVATEDARQPFDLHHGPLLRARVVRLSATTHRIYITLHHIVFDGVAIYRVVMPELAALYAAFSQGETPRLPEVAVQYGDYALWRQGRLDGANAAEALDYWRAKLAGLPFELKLPFDRPPTEASRHRGSMVTFELSPALTAALKSVSVERHATLYSALLAAFKAMLYRYSGQDDIAIGGATDIRNRPELERSVGYFLNSVVLRTRPRGETPFLQFLADVQSTVVEAVDASAVPFDRVVRAVQPARHGATHPLFQVLFSMEPPAPPFPPGWALTQMDVTIGTTKFDLYLELDEQDGRVIGRFIYSTDLFDRDTVERMVGHWQTLLMGVVADPDCRLKDLPLLTADELRQLDEINDTAQAFPATTLHGCIAVQASRSPDAVAVEGQGERWTYRELGDRAAGVARILRDAGVRPGMLVGIAMERSPAMVAGLLGILRAGAAYLPLDPDLPPARIALLVEDGQPEAILTEPSVAGRLPASRARLVLYEADAAAVGGGDATETAPGDLAYVLYTSGSTGKPKAVEIEHRSVVNLLTAVQRDLDFGPADSLLAVTTLSFDIAGLELFLPLIAGGRLVIADKLDTVDPFRLMALLSSSGCTAMQATPALWRALVQAGWQGDPKVKALCGGDVLPQSLARDLVARVGTLWNMYGPTETTIWSLRHLVSDDGGQIPIGKPLANTTIHVVDRDGNAVPPGVAGELLIGGAGVARGYRGDPQLTARKFVTWPGISEQRLYRTGDAVKRRADGALEFLGRTDNQVKVRGFRVGLEEVEEALVRCPGIAAAAVSAVTDPSGDMTLAAFVVAATGSTATAASWQESLRQRLPSYMVPTVYVALPSLPMTASGKIDRARLPKVAAASAADRTPPRDALEQALVEIWREVLAVDDIGIHDNFFDLGGHSLLAFILLVRIKARWAKDLTMAALFSAPTVAGLAGMLRKSGETEFSHLVCLRPEGTGRPIFIVHGIYGNVLHLAALAKLVRTDRPIWALQARGVDPRLEPHQTIAEMSAAYIAAIRTVQPGGPYAIAGYSFGGLVAFDMATRLRREQEQVEFLGLFETDLHERHLPPFAKLAYQWTLARRVAGKLAILPRSDWPGYLRQKMRKLRSKLMSAPEVPDLLPGIPAAFTDRYREMYAIGLRECERFRPGRYDGMLTLFSVRGPRFDTCNPLPIWRRSAKALRVLPISGQHDTIMDQPHVRSLADQLSLCLAPPQPPVRGLGSTRGFTPRLLTGSPRAARGEAP
jgi:amino acid adenylation domain-containing protein